MNLIKHLIMEEVPGGEVGALGGGGVPDPAPAPPAEPPAEPTPSIYGDLQVKFPEGIDPEIKESTFLKPFVDKESGEVNYSNLMKSYVHAQKNVHSSKVVIPGENATDQELDEFYSKLGYKVDEGEYVLNKPEGSTMPDEALEGFKKFARENRLPLNTAQKMAEYLDSTMSSVTNGLSEQQSKEIEAGLDSVKEEWGQAYDQNLKLAQKVLNDVLSPEEVKAFNDPRIGSNPAIMKMLYGLGKNLYKEDGIKGGATQEIFSPQEAQAQINEIMADPAYWDKNSPRQKDLVAKVTKLHEMKQGR